jgi:hypothetical protein
MCKVGIRIATGKDLLSAASEIDRDSALRFIGKREGLRQLGRSAEWRGPECLLRQCCSSWQIPSGCCDGVR